MRSSILTIFLAVVAVALGCATSAVDRGESLFAGCVDRVDYDATVSSGLFVCEGERDPEPFGGNGRSCGDCHVPADNFGISLETIANLPPDHPFFFMGLDENPELMRRRGLVRVVVPGQIDEQRRTPKLTHLKRLCDEDGNCDSMGLLGDRVRNLCAFSLQAIENHMAKSVERIPGRDFRAPTEEECEALIAYMLSDRVAEKDDRSR